MHIEHCYASFLWGAFDMLIATIKAENLEHGMCFVFINMHYAHTRDAHLCVYVTCVRGAVVRAGIFLLVKGQERSLTDIFYFTFLVFLFLEF
jgi:hypothetical protein